MWDSEKASYFIESILLGTEIPPLVFFQTQSANEVIDGRQRYETIERFLNDRFLLNESGLHCLKSLAGKKYSQLDENIREQFEETRKVMKMVSSSNGRGLSNMMRKRRR